jgi:RND superfamily putative drug exporter
MSRWTRLVLRFRWVVLVCWLVAIGVGVVGSRSLGRLTSNQFTVPGTASEEARTILQQHFGDRSDGGFIVVFRPRGTGPARVTPRLQAALARGVAAIPGGRAEPLRAAGPIVYGSISSGLGLGEAKLRTPGVRAALRPPPGVQAYVTGQAAIQYDLDPIFSQDLAKGESIALPIALAVLLLVFGASVVVTMPLLFAAATIFGTLAIVWGMAHLLVMATYATNLVELIGLGIAVDYSLLVVYRFREELRRGDAVEDAIERTMATAGRAVVFSGATVAIGLALLVLMPVPFIRSLGVAGFFIPLVSIAGALTLQPALLSLYGRRGTRRIPLLPPRFRAEAETGFWHRLAGSIMRRPVVWLAAGTAVLLALAAPVLALQLTPGSIRGIPTFPQSVRGFDLLTRAVGAGTVSPTQIVVDTGGRGGARTPAVRAAVGRLAAELRHDPEVVAVRTGRGWPYVDPSGRYVQIVAAGKHEYGEAPAQRFVHRLRGTLVPEAGFPGGVRVLAGGGPPQGVDFLARAYGAFPWLIGAVLVLTYLLLARAFRSLLLPLKAVLLNLLSVAASYGMLVVVFHWGVGSDVLGLYQMNQIEGWIPIFLFAMLFGLSMDYEVFLVTRMRESWDDGLGNREAVAEGLERTGRIVTAAAAIMVAAFSAFVAGRIVGLQEFGLGLAIAIVVDATIVRAVLVPSLMALFGRWNWWLPPGAARVLRVAPSPLGRRAAAVSRAR